LALVSCGEDNRRSLQVRDPTRFGDHCLAEEEVRMGRIEGSASVEIDAPPDVVFAVAADVERMPSWQSGLLAAVVLERDRARRPRLVRIETSHGAAVVRFTYKVPLSIAWHQEQGDAAHFAGAWRFTAVAGGKTRASYEVDVDLGRGFGLLVRGPVRARLRERFIDAIPLRLRDRVESSDAGLVTSPAPGRRGLPRVARTV
jgi:hypothetical protein